MRSRGRDAWLGIALTLTVFCFGAVAAEASTVGEDGFELLTRQPSQFSLFDEKQTGAGVLFLGEPLEIFDPQPCFIYRIWLEYIPRKAFESGGSGQIKI